MDWEGDVYKLVMRIPEVLRAFEAPGLRSVEDLSPIWISPPFNLAILPLLGQFLMAVARVVPVRPQVNARLIMELQ